MVVSVADGSAGGGGGRSRMAIVFVRTVRLTEGGSTALLSSRKPPFGSPSAVPSSGAEVGHGEAPGGVVASIERRDSRKEDERAKVNHERVGDKD